MRELPKPPHSSLLSEESRLNTLFEAMGFAETSEGKATIEKANERYFHWEKFQRRPAVGNISLETAWIAVENSRKANRRTLPLQDGNQRPFSYIIPPSLQKALHLVDKQAGGNLQIGKGFRSSPFQGAKDSLIVNSLFEEAISTALIEGAVTTRSRAKEILREGLSPQDKSERMIVNSYRAILWIKERVKDPLSLSFLHELQAIVTQGTLESELDAGRLRSAEDEIVIKDSSDDEIIFVPPPARELMERLERLFVFANEEQENFIHPLVKACVIHFWVAHDHPYVDGNGRTARALFYWFMLKSGYWLFEFLSISSVINSSKNDYYKSFLYAEQDENDLTYSLHYMLKSTEKAVQVLSEKIEDRVAKIKALETAFRLEDSLNLRQRELLAAAMQDTTGRFTIEGYRRTYAVTYQTARTDLLALEELGYLKRTQKGKTILFLPGSKLLKTKKH